MHDFKRLRVWEAAVDLTAGIDAMLRRFPHREHGVIASRLRRAALSIPANIADGCGKSSRKETVRFLQIASGSACEAENHVLVAQKLGHVPASDCIRITERLRAVQRMLTALMRKLPE